METITRKNLDRLLPLLPVLKRVLEDWSTETYVSDKCVQTLCDKLDQVKVRKPSDRRTTELVAFGHLLSRYMEDHYPGFRVECISSPKKGGDITILLASCDGSRHEACVYTSDGQFIQMGTAQHEDQL